MRVHVVDGLGVVEHAVRGTLAGVVRWAAGRGAVGVTGGEATPPRWL